MSLGIVGVHPIHLGRLEHQVDIHFHSAQSSSSVRSEKRIAGSGGKNNDLPFLKVAHRLAAYVRLNHLLDVERGLHPAHQADLAHRILDCQGIHHRCQHAHVVRSGAVHVCGTRRHATENVAATNDNGHLNAKPDNFRDFANDAVYGVAVDAIVVITHQRLATQLEQDALVGRGF